MPKVLVLGGYGLIGSACCRALLAEGFDVRAIGRSESAARQSGLQVEWLFADLALANSAEWNRLVDGVDVVVNAAGALQDGLRDNLDAIHDRAVAAMVQALAGTHTRIVQISAAGVSPDAPTEFLRSKARGDARVASSGLDWVILRPTLVISHAAYGGTALLRAVAALPLISVRILSHSTVQTVWVGDLAQAVVDAASDRIEAGTIADLTEAGSRSFAETVLLFRRWLGLPEWKRSIDLPRVVVAPLGRIADLLGWLGWRSPLRGNALRSLESGITGDPGPWLSAGGRPCRSLEDTLVLVPASVQERWFARMYLLLPLSIAILSLFWICSGLIALVQPDRSAAVLTERGVGAGLATGVALIGGMLDVMLGFALLVRRWTVKAASGMIAVSAAYLLGSAAFAPDLWLDPLGPMLKVLPSLPLALIVAALMDER
ncbi:MAG: oxidoreductase [Cereibacter sphaeroides]|uniref:Oxidoreductase n=1 Tax=Cereibacter sphaeroides TaxID=1063 RepID=A0A2W5SF23_CERSP|nr:MAG: oxidoreductase [Cereibacter sphaeroides]